MTINTTAASMHITTNSGRGHLQRDFGGVYIEGVKKRGTQGTTVKQRKWNIVIKYRFEHIDDATYSIT